VSESREHLLPWLPWATEHVTADDSVTWIHQSRANWLLRNPLPVGLFSLDTHRLLGGSGLSRINWEIRAFEIGYWVRASEQGHGYVSESTRALTQLAFDSLAASRVEIRVDPRNTRSLHVPRALGFTHEGTLRRVSPPADSDEPTDRAIFALIREEYDRLPWREPPEPGPD